MILCEIENCLKYKTETIDEILKDGNFPARAGQSNDNFELSKPGWVAE